MRRPIAIPTVILGIVATGCADQPTALPLTTSTLSIEDAVHGDDGNEHFFWLPPMVSNPSYNGTFDGALSPKVEICEWTGTACSLPMLAEFTTATGPGSETVRVNQGEEHYIVNWHTNEFSLDEAKTYRIVVQVGAQELGHADVDVVTTGGQLRNVDTNEYIPLKDGRTLPIKFRIENGALDQCAEIAFVDANLDAFVRQLVGIPTGPVTGPDVSGITSLDIRNQGVVSLEGLHCFTGLTALNAGAGNAIVDITPISALIGLTFVGLRSNQVSDLTPLSGLTNLTGLDIAVLPISDLSPLAPLTSMVGLTMFDNPGITDITPLAGMTQLEVLILRNSPINGTETALSAMTQMTSLTLVNAGVTDLGFLTGMTNLEGVALRGNQITDLSPLIGLPSLTFLDAAQNLLTDVTPFTSMTGLTSLVLFDNPGISDITPLGSLTNLTFLHLRNTNVGTQASVLQSLTQVTGLRIDNAGLSDLTFVSPMTLLTDLSVRGNSISDATPLLALSNLAGLDIIDNPITCSDAVLIQLESNGVNVFADFAAGGSGPC